MAYEEISSLILKSNSIYEHIELKLNAANEVQNFLLSSILTAYTLWWSVCQGIVHLNLKTWQNQSTYDYIVLWN